MNKTTELDAITFGKGSNFTWGEAIKKHSIGEYGIIEFYPYLYVGNCSTGKIDYSTRAYSCYINSRDISRSTSSLDYALVACIANKYEGTNTRADGYFMRMIKGGK